ncbi:hypothetical protein ZZ1p0048 [Acinetobacter phage ZZ1]|jgi:hypothetical protein|uniref:Uncharacterized protein n=3 Tax=Caudoviricetes TaxID=2731619 RepID=A0A410T645_9CAUD|nr:hypothetical protein ZZ1p0048 [Acinetobacter phage ZZ1]AFL47577.1 hypothetical protein ZZ1p0048 [Acinetobacter phage ZZ1]QAU04083.1 hypothetical protein Henu6_gp103 [Acinetobacter phage Henu6]
MKVYKVIKGNILGKVLGNSTKPLHATHPLCQTSFVRISDDGFVYSLTNEPIWRQREVAHLNSHLKLTCDDIKLFVEYKEEEIVHKIAHNFKYNVVEFDYGEYNHVKTFDNIQDAADHCIYLNEYSNGVYEVQVDFDILRVKDEQD